MQPKFRLWRRGWSGRRESLLRLKIGTRDAAGVDMHARQLTVSTETVRELVAEQFPRWRSLAIQAVDAAGTVNAIFRIGGRFAARFALEPRDAGPMRRLLESEAAAARELAGRTRFDTPEPVAPGHEPDGPAHPGTHPGGHVTSSSLVTITH